MENRTLLAFIFGAAVGSGITYLCVKSHFNDISNAEIEETREYYKQLQANLEAEYEQKMCENAEKSPKNVEKSDILVKKEPKIEKNDAEQAKYNEIIHKLNYGEYFKKEDEAPVEDRMDPFIITDDEWDENNGYDKVWLTFFEDDEVFVDDCENVVENGIDLIGESNLTEFGEFEENTLYIRNNKYGTDYMVTLEHSSYRETYSEYNGG